MKTILFLFLLGIGSTEQIMEPITVMELKVFKVQSQPDVLFGFITGDDKKGVLVTVYQLRCGGFLDKIKTVRTDKDGFYYFNGLKTSAMFKVVPEKEPYKFYPEFLQIFLPKWK